MNPVKLNLPRTARVVFNALTESPQPSRLTQDLLAIELGDGCYIDVSWHPEFDPTGTYTITVFRGAWEGAETEVETQDISEVIKRVQNLAWFHEGMTWENPPGGMPVSFTSGSISTAFKAYEYA